MGVGKQANLMCLACVSQITCNPESFPLCLKASHFYFSHPANHPNLLFKVKLKFNLIFAKKSVDMVLDMSNAVSRYLVPSVI